jgi:K+-transporting ATPase KdpF subunit
MGIETAVIGLLAVGVLGYLVWALLNPERL